MIKSDTQQKPSVTLESKETVIYKSFIFLLLFLMIGCSREPLNGTIYVIKGDGGIARGAAIDVHILTFEDINEFDDLKENLQEQKENDNLSRYLSVQCALFAPSKKESLLAHRNTLSQYSNECNEEKRNFAELPYPDEIGEKILQEERRLLVEAQKEIEKLKIDAISKIKTSYDYSGRWVVVSITNESELTISSGEAEYIGVYVAEKLISYCRDKVFLRPGETAIFSLGSCYSGDLVQKNRLKLVKEGAEICIRRSKQLCVDDFAPGASLNEKGDWKIVSNQLNLKKVLLSFDQGRLLNLKSELEVSSKALSLANECSEINTVITPKIARLEKLSCPETGSDRKKIQLFNKSANSLGINLSPLPFKPKFNYSDFIYTLSATSVTTDIDGKFSFQAPPNKNFLLYARYNDNFSTMEWILQINPEAKTIELNNSNSL